MLEQDKANQDKTNQAVLDHTRTSTHIGSQDVVALTDVYKQYQIGGERIDALRGVNLNVPRGSIVAVTGKSGAGKSTLLHLIGVLDQPSSGSVRINQVDVSRLADQVASHFRNATIGFVFQMNNLLREFSAVENVMLPGMIAGAAKDRIYERAFSLLKAVGLQHRLNHKPGELSGGEQQRVAIARALVMAPPLLLADEPTGNLDQKTSHEVQELLLEVCVRQQMTMMLVTHDPDLAKRMPSQVVMEDGKVVDGGFA